MQFKDLFYHVSPHKNTLISLFYQFKDLFYPNEKPVPFSLPTNDMLPYGYKEFALPDSGYHLLSQEVGYEEGWYDMTWEEGHHDHSKELEHYRDPSKPKPHFEVQRASSEDYPSLRRMAASMSSTLSTSMKE